MVRVIEGKITVTVRRKTRGNRLWFELARGSSCWELTNCNHSFSSSETMHAASRTKWPRENELVKLFA